MRLNPAIVLRSLLFYIAFYGGSFCLALLAAFVPLLGRWWAVALAHVWARWHRICVERIVGITIRIEGVRPDGPVLVAGKHESMFEAIDLPNLFRMPVPFAKAELLRLPLWGRVGRLYGLIPVERDQGAKALRAMRLAAEKFAAEGPPMIIFPEGTRVPFGTTPKLQAGFAGLYKILNLPVVPFAVDSGRLMRGLWKRPGTITVRFGETIPPGLPRTEIEARVHEAINVLNQGAAT